MSEGVNSLKCNRVDEVKNGDEELSLGLRGYRVWGPMRFLECRLRRCVWGGAR